MSGANQVAIVSRAVTGSGDTSVAFRVRNTATAAAPTGVQPETGLALMVNARGDGAGPDPDRTKGGPTSFQASPGAMTWSLAGSRINSINDKFYQTWWLTHADPAASPAAGITQKNTLNGDGSVNLARIAIFGDLVFDATGKIAGDELENRALVSRPWASGDWSATFTTRRTTPAVSSWGDRTKVQFTLYVGLRGTGAAYRPLHLAAHGANAPASIGAYRGRFQGFEVPIHVQTPSAAPGTTAATCSRLSGDGTAAAVTPSASVTWDDAQDTDYAWTLTKTGTTLTVRQGAKTVSFTHASLGASGHVAFMVNGGLSIDLSSFAYTGTSTATGAALVSDDPFPTPRVSYCFPNAGDTAWTADAPTIITTGWSPTSAAFRTAARRNLAAFATACGLSFVETADSAAANIIYVFSTGIGAVAAQTSIQRPQSYCAFPPSFDASGWALGTYNSFGISHESLHALGFDHPQSTDFTSGGWSYPQTLMHGGDTFHEALRTHDIEGIALAYGVDPAGTRAPPGGFPVDISSWPAGTRADLATYLPHVAGLLVRLYDQTTASHGTTRKVSVEVMRGNGAAVALTDPNATQFAMPLAEDDDWTVAVSPSAGTARVTLTAGATTTSATFQDVVTARIAAYAPQGNVVLLCSAGRTFDVSRMAVKTSVVGATPAASISAAPADTEPVAANTVAATAKLALSAAAAAPASVTWTLTGLATSDMANGVLTGTATFPAGQTSLDLVLTFAAEALVTDKSATLTISAPSGCVLGTPTSVGFKLLHSSTPAGWPYPKSSKVTAIALDWSKFDSLAPGSDNWVSTWDQNDRALATWGDGNGFGGGRVSIGIASVTGTQAGSLGGTRLVGGGSGATVAACFPIPAGSGYPSDTNAGGPCNGTGLNGKSYGPLAYNGNLYLWTVPQHVPGSYSKAKLFKAGLSSLGSWSAASWQFTNSTGWVGHHPTFLQAGKGYADRFDGYLYTVVNGWAPVAAGVTTEMQPGKLYLMRCAIADDPMTQGKWQWFTGTAASPTWGTYANRKAAWTDSGKAGWACSVFYSKAIDRCLLFVTWGAWDSGQIGVYEAQRPWGPWSTVDRFRIVDSHSPPRFDPSVFIASCLTRGLSTDGRSFPLVMSGSNSADALVAVQATLTVT